MGVQVAEKQEMPASPTCACSLVRVQLNLCGTTPEPSLKVEADIHVGRRGQPRHLHSSVRRHSV